MNIVIGTVFIGAVAIWVWTRLPNAAWRQASYRAFVDTFLFTAPRVLVALLGAGFFAELLPDAQVRRFLGDEAGVGAILLATAIAPLTPGGPFVSFAIAAAALKTGAAPSAAIAYVTAWMLFSATKIFAYELSFMGRRATAIRLMVSLPVPLVVAWISSFAL